MKRLMVSPFFVLMVLAGGAWAEPIDAAKALFERYVSLGQAFDEALADLYADNALIKNVRVYPGGQTRQLTMPALKYKQLIRMSMPLAKAKGDTNTYSALSFTWEGAGVRIGAVRYSKLKRYSSPLSLWVAPDATGKWLIREELSQSQP